MAFQVSPGINVSEIDLTAGIPAVSTSTGAIAGEFRWGPADFLTPVSSEAQLASQFYAPNDSTAALYLTATSFLSYSSDLLVVRAVNATSNSLGNVAAVVATGGTLTAIAAANSNVAAVATVSGNNTVLIKNEEAYFLNEYTGTANANVAFAARYPGALGNSLKLSICPSANAFNGYYPDGTGANAFSTAWQYASNFSSAPGTSPYVSARGGSNDEMHIIVIDEDGLISGSAGTVLEKYPFVSKASDARTDDGSSNYYEEVLYKSSKYVYQLNHPTNNDYTSGNTSTVSLAGTNTSNWGTVSTNTFGRGNNYIISFTNGNDGTVSSANVVNAYSFFSNPEYVDVSLIMQGTGDTNVATAIISTAESRKDCVALISPPLDKADTLSNITNWRNNTLNASSSYAIMDSGWKYMYDKYNDKYRWVPLNGDIAGLCARTDSQRDPWFSPAGYQRGVIKNVVKLKFNPSKTDRDTLYKAGINPVVAFPGEGTVLFGDKTLLSRTSAFDRINVRRLFIVLEKAISRAAKASLFEFNDEFTRAQFVSLVEPFLRTVQGRRGIYDFRVVCDTTNNTPDLIDRNEFVGDIYIKPARSINYIQLNFVAVRTGVSFDEVVGKF
jgi:phage tail sheath protein FI